VLDLRKIILRIMFHLWNIGHIQYHYPNFNVLHSLNTGNNSNLVILNATMSMVTSCKHNRQNNKIIKQKCLKI